MRSLRTTLLCATSAAAVLLAACGGGTTSSATTTTAASPAAMATAKGGAMKGAAGSLTVNLAAQNGSKETGTATLTDTKTAKGAALKVVTSLGNEPEYASEPEHIHLGTCAKLGGVYKPLTNVAGGKATSTVAGLTIAQLKKGTYAINVHKSLAQLQVYVSCGNIK